MSIVHRGRIFTACALILGLSLGLLSRPSQAASFDCKSINLSMNEREICDDEKLSALDSKLATLYAEVKQKLEPSAVVELQRSQRDWIRLRNQCASAECLSDAYQSRIQALGAPDVLADTKDQPSPQFQANGALPVISKDLVAKLISGRWLVSLGPNPFTIKITAITISDNGCLQHYSVASLKSLEQEQQYEVILQTKMHCSHGRQGQTATKFWISHDQVRSRKITEMTWYECDSLDEVARLKKRDGSATCSSYTLDRQ